MRTAKPILATAAIALSLAACQWMGGGEQQAAERPTGTAGMSGGAAQPAPTAQSYPPPSAQQAQQAPSVSPDLVQSVQRRLGDRGYDVGPVDGVWGESTRSALQNFQRDQGLQQSGQLDRQTLAALGIQPSGQQAQAGQQEPYRSTTRRGQQQSMVQPQPVSPDIVRDIQQNLRDRGYDAGQVDGIWGPNTSRALMAFQQDENLRATGRITPQSLAALGIAQPQVGQLPERQQRRQQQEQVGEEPDGLGLFEPEFDIGPAEEPQ